jgi:hypothetical protein
VRWRPRASGHAERLASLALIEPYAERLAALALIEPRAERPQPLTLGADKGYDSSDFVIELREQAVTRTSPRTRAGLGDRRPHHPPPRLCDLAAHPQTHRGGLRLGRDTRIEPFFSSLLD